MINARTEKPELRDVLNEFVMAEDYPTRAALEAWIRQYPQFERELADFASVWIAEEILAEPAALTSEDESLIVTRAMSEVENLLYRHNQTDTPAAASAATTPISSLIRSARVIGLDVPALVQACQIDRTLLVKLEARQIKARTIPQRLISLIAEALQRTMLEVAAFFEQPSRIVPGTSFFARSTPQASTQESFVDAVRSSALSDELKEFWLAEAAKHDPPD